MARIRTLKPDFFRSRSLAGLPLATRVTFQGLWCEADDVGNGVADPRILKGAIWPLDDEVSWEDVAQHLVDLERTGHIARYESDGESYYHVVTWAKHQSAAYRRGIAQYPQHPARPVVQAARPVVLEGKGREGKGKEIDLARFEEFWKAYPRKRDKGHALKAWLRATQRSTPDEIIAGAVDFRRRCTSDGTEPRFIPHATTWLNGQRWADEPDPAVVKMPKGFAALRRAEERGS